MKYLFPFVIICILPLLSFAQQANDTEVTVTGTVLNEQENPLPGASVAIYDSTMSTVITGDATETNGEFSISLNPGDYTVQITFVSYEPYEEDIEIGAEQTYDLGSIVMQPATQTLGELVVRAEESRMVLRFDKRVFQVGQDIVSLGGSALNVLQNVPSLLVDIDGNLSLRGNESVRVLINGKPSSLVEDDVSALRSIPASMIKSVEIITNPSAEYSAEGSAGIINIILKKKTELGFNGSANLGVGHPSDYELGTNINYRVNDINLFFGGSVDYRSRPEEGNSFQRFSSPDTAYMYRELMEGTESEYDVDIRLGVDFFLSENETLSASTNMELENGKDDQDILFTDYEYQAGAIYEDPSFNAPVIQRIFRDNVEDSEEQEIEFNLEYENRYDGEDHNLSAEADFDISRESEFTNINERIGNADLDPLVQRINNSEESMDFRADIDYVRPLGENGRFQAGARTAFDWMESTYRFEQRQDGIFEDVPAFNNNYVFNENVNSAYIIAGSEFGSFSGQVGLRFENTNIYTELQISGDENEQNYTDLFPSAFLNYSLNDQNSFQLSYSRRFNRPWSRLLLPFTDFSESRSRFTGNPDLKPEFSNSFEAGYLRYWQTGSLLTSLYYRHRTDVIERITILDDDGITRRLPINLATEHAWGVEFSADQDIIDGLTLTANANFYSSQTEGQYQDILLASSTQTFQTRFGIRWNINDSWNFQGGARYRAPRETTQGERAAITVVNAGISRELFDDQATISLSVRDLLNSRNYESTITNDGNPATDFYSHREFRWSSRSFTLNFRYYFGQVDNRGR